MRNTSGEAWDDQKGQGTELRALLCRLTTLIRVRDKTPPPPPTFRLSLNSQPQNEPKMARDPRNEEMEGAAAEGVQDPGEERLQEELRSATFT